MTVCCGLSGSGKSSLAMDTIYAEGQRRYVESLSSYARQFVGQMQKPKLDYIDGLSPAIAIEQKHMGHTPRSTVGTVTEIYDYLRVLMARLGQPYCPACDIPIGTQSADEIIDKLMAEAADTRLYRWHAAGNPSRPRVRDAVGRNSRRRLSPHASRRENLQRRSTANHRSTAQAFDRSRDRSGHGPG